ncbi:hypothetical protein [Qipengyuania seohaensis]|uniref:hypothetical protein n=1 Tax=Qipengyuania seohaensis TaxID=266951 RepID=UPI001E4C630B|nr:hypothetical protein [Qipengyuania seohaensis]
MFLAMVFYRFLTRNRVGKWYASLTDAQRNANEIGAGFTGPGGSFTAYRGTILEMQDQPGQREWAKRKDQ